MQKTTKGKIMFQLNDNVKWSSQAGGAWKEKRGIVSQVLEPMELPDRNKFPALYRNNGIGRARNTRTYVVLVKNKPYWPRLSALSKA